MASIAVNLKCLQEALAGLRSTKVTDRRVRFLVTEKTLPPQAACTLSSSRLFWFLFSLVDTGQVSAVNLERILTNDADEALFRVMESGQRGVSWQVVLEAAMEHVEKVTCFFFFYFLPAPSHLPSSFPAFVSLTADSFSILLRGLTISNHDSLCFTKTRVNVWI
jgi:hypothetical protein